MSINVTLVRLTPDDAAWLRATVHAPPFSAEPDRTDAWFGRDHPDACELGKAFAGVHFLLTGTLEGGRGVLSFLGNEAIGEPVPYEFAYGPGRILSPLQVGQLAGALRALPPDTLDRRLASPALGEAYPFSVDGELDDDDRAWLRDALATLRAFLTATADQGSAVLVASW